VDLQGNGGEVGGSSPSATTPTLSCPFGSASGGRLAHMSAPRLPTFYIPHGGGPCFFMSPKRCEHGFPCDYGYCRRRSLEDISMFMDWPYPTPNPWTGLAAWLSSLATTLDEAPKAVIVVSGHWEEDPVAVNVQAHPPLLYDYYGFPEHTYRLQYPAPGSPALAGAVHELLASAGIPAREESRRGLDHGVFVPFKLIYPRADVPIVQLSLRRGLDPAAHIALGAALAPLRRQGVLIVGSGMSFHNLGIRSIENARIPPSEQFDDWLAQAVCQPDPGERNARLTRWASAPAARFAHPREEHLMPLMVAAGAAGDDRGSRTFSGRIMGWRISGFRFGTDPT
jgi:aromatic ring-opening dioxygenase catalytic subunit (LigB family)